MRFILSLSSCLIFIGCLSRPPERVNYVEMLSTTKLLEIDLNNVTASAAIDDIRLQWRKLTGDDLPVCEVYKDARNVSTQRITLTARHISALDAVRVVSSLAKCRIQFLQNGIALTDIWPEEFIGIEQPLTEDVKTVLGVGEDPSSEQLKLALIKNGVDFSKGDMKISVIPARNSVIIIGFTENVEIAKAVLCLIHRGYEIKRFSGADSMKGGTSKLLK